VIQPQVNQRYEDADEGDDESVATHAFGVKVAGQDDGQGKGDDNIYASGEDTEGGIVEDGIQAIRGPGRGARSHFTTSSADRWFGEGAQEAAPRETRLDRFTSCSSR
jgi:hypothetical protein